MKRNIYKLSVLALMMLLCLPFTLKAVEKSDSSTVEESRLTFAYLCTSNDSVQLTANLYVKKGSEPYGLMNATIEFSTTQNAKPVMLGTAITNQDGDAVLNVAISSLLPGKDGMITYQAKFAGTKKYTEILASASAEPAKLKLSFNIQDSVRYLNVTATREDSKGQEGPLPGLWNPPV